MPRKWRAAEPRRRYAASLTVKAERFMSESVPERDKEFLKYDIKRRDRFGHALKLSFFIKHKLGIRAVLFVGANEQEIDIRDDAEADFIIELAFKLIAEICFAIV